MNKRVMAAVGAVFILMTLATVACNQPVELGGSSALPARFYNGLESHRTVGTQPALIADAKGTGVPFQAQANSTVVASINRDGDLSAVDLYGTGNLKIGNGTPSVTQDGEDGYVEGGFEVDGASNLGGAVTLGATLLSAPASVAATTGALVSTGYFQPLTATGTVTPTITPGTAGTATCFVMTSSATAVFVDTGNVVLASNFSMGQYDVLCGRSDGTRWIEFARTNN